MTAEPGELTAVVTAHNCIWEMCVCVCVCVTLQWWRTTTEQGRKAASKEVEATPEHEENSNCEMQKLLPKDTSRGALTVAEESRSEQKRKECEESLLWG